MDTKTNPTSKYQDRVIRVFVSSTFRDMHAEREELVKQIFPQLRKLCSERQVVWSEVDLRWGIPDEEKAEGKVLPICLAEIQRSRPYFIGILGERYGWMPDEIPADLIEQEPWLSEHKDHSVTELEILHGVLNNPNMENHAYFYLRDPAYIESIPEDKREDFTTEDAASAEKLQRLKDKIEKSRFFVRKDYLDPKALGELILNDFTELIDKLYPKRSEPDPLDREAADHNAYAQSRSRVYIGRMEYFKRLDDHIKSDDPPLVILGESGSGKSALISNWAFKFQKDNPDTFVLMHFIGSSPKSADYTDILLRIMKELKRRFDLPQEIPKTPEQLKQELPNWLSMASVKGRFVIILDALNQLEDRDNANELTWLPEYFPKEVRVIVSTLLGRTREVLNERKWPTYQIKLLDPKEREKLIEEYLEQYTKRLSPEFTETMANAEQTANPLYLRTLLEELRIFGRHEELEECISYYLKAEKIEDLYSKILERYEKDYERDRPGLVGDSMTLIWAARRGLSETELMELLGSKGQPLAPAYWSPLYLAAEESLIMRSGLVSFSHDYIRKAIQNRYLQTEEQINKANLKIADYFEIRELDHRKVDELPWQLKKTNMWSRLYDLLADLPFFDATYTNNEFDVKAYWSRIEKETHLLMVDAYNPVLESPDQYIDYIWDIAKLFSDTGYLNEALQLREFQVEYYRKSGNIKQLATSIGNQAFEHYTKGHLEKAMGLYKEQERIARKIDDKYQLQVSLGNQALILSYIGELDNAMELHKKKEDVCREFGHKKGLLISLNNQANILSGLGELDNAMELHKEVEWICKEIGDKDLLVASLNGQAGIHYQRGGLNKAMERYKEVEQICREFGNKKVLAGSLTNQANILFNLGELDNAMGLNKEAELIYRKLGDNCLVQVSLASQANILSELGEQNKAIKVYKEVELASRILKDKYLVAFVLGRQANILSNCGNQDKAMELYKEQEQISRKINRKAELAVCLNGQAFLQLNHFKNRLAARTKSEEALEIYTEMKLPFKIKQTRMLLSMIRWRITNRLYKFIIILCPMVYFIAGIIHNDISNCRFYEIEF